MICFPLDNTPYEAKDMGTYLATRTRGVFSSDGNLAVAPSESGLSVSVSPGLAWLKWSDYWGTAALQEQALTLDLDTADGALKRIDAIVCRLDKVNNRAEIVVKKGAPSSAPIVVPPVRDANYDELYIATVLIGAGVISISASAITDQRLNEEYCGLMRDGVTGIPTASLHAQAQQILTELTDALNAQIVRQSAEFDAWFDDLKGKLGEDPATALQQQVDNLNAAVVGDAFQASGTPVSIAYAGTNRIASIIAYGENAQGGTTEAPVALTGISSITVNDDVTELPIPRPLRRVGDVKDKCVTRQDYESAEKLVVTYNVGFVELDGTEGIEYQSAYNRFAYTLPSTAVNDSGFCSHYKKLMTSTPGEDKYIVIRPEAVYFYDSQYTNADAFNAYLAAQKAAGTPVQIAYQLAAPEVYATDPVDFDNAAGPLTVMTGGEVEVRMTELVGNREFTERLSYIGNPNLLDNSNFTNPVNQRDGTSYSASTGNAAYAIDRWRIEGATYNVATHTLSGTSYTNRACRMAQFIEMAQYGLNIGDDMTFSIMANGTKHSATAKVLDRDQYSNFESVPSAYSCDDFDIVLCTGLGKPSILSFTICAKKSLVLEWAKLEKGSVATPYVHKSYGAELSACQRYFYYLDATKWYACYQITGWGLIIPIDLPVPMRAQPTANTVGEVKVFTPSGWVNATSVSTNQFNRDKARINIVLTMPSGSMDSYEGRAMVATGIESLSADL